MVRVMPAQPPSGLLIIDKPCGPTSHDVVGRVRRTLGTRSVGHAGTLDPMATGVLVVMVGACTKLSRFLTLDEKVYRATVSFGRSTNTLDTEGETTASAPLPAHLVETLGRIERGEEPDDASVQEALACERQRTEQVPPAHSAIKQGGVAAYRKARRGQQVSLPAREVHVVELRVLGADVASSALQVMLHVSKGYYVRSFARDLGEALGVPSHLSALRRVRSGPWELEGAVGMDAEAEVMSGAMVSLEEVARRSLRSCELTDEGARRAVYGQRLSEEDFRSPPGEGVWAWFNGDGRLVAVGDRARGTPTVQRAFLHADDLC